ncbi:MAG: outer membrane protein [Planctomycetota bacterium]|jgi:hypothetical protein
MSRSCFALGVLVAAAGCGATVLAPSVPSDAVLDGRVTGAPEVATVTRSIAAAGRRNRVAGYYWIGYTPADFGAGDLSDLGSGDGFTCGLGLTFSEAGRAFLEIAFEKTVNHSYAPILGTGSATPQTGHHERLLLGGRTTATAMARMEKQPRPYLSYGVSNNKYRVDVASGSGSSYEATGFGAYLGLGVEYPFAQKMSFSFDTRYHMWTDTDTNGLDGKFASVAMSLLWVGRF